MLLAPEKFIEMIDAVIGTSKSAKGAKQRRSHARPPVIGDLPVGPWRFFALLEVLSLVD
jgi:hypothetical protein